MTGRTKTRLQRAGATAVEFAIVAPIVFGLIWITFEFMRVAMIQNQADIASYEAARLIIVPGAKVAEAETEAMKYLRYLGTRDVEVTVIPTDGNNVVQEEIDDDTARVRVTIEIPFASNALILSRFIGNRTITSSTTLTFESYSGFYDGVGF